MRLLIGTSTKMNLTSTEALSYCETLRPLVDDVTDRDLFVLPPYTAIWAVRDKLAGSPIAWGAQDVHPEDAGAHTGDVSAPMLADLGCTYVEVGHAERRRDYGESDEYVARQVAAIQNWGMTAIVCVGEHEKMPLASTMAWIGRQLGALSAADPGRVVVAYEPEWAIGVGAAAAEPEWVGEVHGAIHAWLQANLAGADSIPVIYGGSVDSSSAGGILAQPGVNGLFVGRSALDPVEFARIAHLETAGAEVGGVHIRPGGLALSRNLSSAHRK
jgi:triosephosphate isomerase